MLCYWTGVLYSTNRFFRPGQMYYFLDFFSLKIPRQFMDFAAPDQIIYKKKNFIIDRVSFVARNVKINIE